MEIISPAQKRFLATAASVEAVASSFFLTGGTALAGYFLHHRLSEDLDLFTQVPRAVPLALAALKQPLADAGFSLEVARAFPSFAELRVAGHGERLKVDLAEDPPFRLAPVTPGAAEGLALDSLDDIAANKLAALFDRAEAKDFVDLYFLAGERLALAALVEHARQKHVGMDDYWLAQAFARAETLTIWPRMLRPLAIDELRSFFVGEADRLMSAVIG